MPRNIFAFVLTALLVAQFAVLALLVKQQGDPPAPRYAIPCLEDPARLLRRDGDGCPAAPVKIGATT